MDTKLTLRLNNRVIEKAKLYASKKKLSLSRLIENYLRSVTSDANHQELEISSFVKSISTNKSIPGQVDEKKEYRAFQERKQK